MPLTENEKKLMYETNDPFALFSNWLKKAEECEGKYPNAMSLATVDETGMPSTRIVLLKGFDVHGFVFYTNTLSKKGKALKNTPKAGLCFYWKSLDRQVRIEGDIEFVTDEEADEYFASRPKVSRIGAWASKQSEPLENYAALIQRVEEFKEKHPDDHVPRPPHWTGYIVKPSRIEFWSEGEFRLHDRIEFLKSDHGDWNKHSLNP
jgi:pyridoxamine 5'-phosphate oxidase